MYTEAQIKQFASSCLPLLAQEFDMPVPNVRCSLKTKRAWAHYNKNLIVIGRKCEHLLDSMFLHEFAHLYSMHKYNYRGHGPVFRVALTEVIKAWYGDVKKYEWDSEYKSIYNWAKKVGHTSKRYGETWWARAKPTS